MAISWFLATGCRSGPPMNVLLITLDTLRSDHLSLYGYDPDTTPFLAQLARDMQKFERAYTPSTWTLPSHASMFTGLYPSQHGATGSGGELAGNPLPEDVTTLAEVLSARGYRTLGIVSGPMLSREFRVDQGFERYSDAWEGARRRADDVNALALEWLDDADGRPFFLFLNYFDPHTPVDPPGYGAEDHPVFEQYGIDVTRFNWRFLRKHDMPGLPEDAASAMLERYDAEIRYLDGALRRLFGELERRRLLEDTIVCIVSDHGESYGEQKRWGHGGPFYEAQARVPLLYRSPRSSHGGGSIPRPITTVEIPSMIARDLGIRDAGPGFEASARVVYGERYGADGSNRMYLDGRYKYLVKLSVADGETRRREQLFDLEQDPGEETDVSSSQPGLLADLRGRFQAFLEAQDLAGEARVASEHGAGPSISDPEGLLREQLEALGYVE
jgi:arylsulfatase A-like enzyme